MREADAGMLNVLGIVTTVFILVLLISAAVVSLTPASRAFPVLRLALGGRQ